MNKIRKGDQVIVTTGRDKGKRGTVTRRVDDSPGGRRRQRRQEARQAEPDEGHHRRRVDKTMPIHQSNVAIFNPTGKADRVGVKLLRCGRQEGARVQVQRRRDQGLSIMAKKQAAEKPPPRPPPRRACRQIYREKIVPDLVAKFGYKSTMQVPRLQKITLNMGVSEAVSDKKVMDARRRRPHQDRRPEARGHQVRKKAIAGFKIRENVAHRHAWSPCAACACTSSWTASSPWPCRACATSAASPAARSMAVATTTSASRNRSSSPKSSTTRSMRCVG
jgi:large subunit ribosomal protein L24